MMEAADKASKATAVSGKRNRHDNDGVGGPNPKSCIVPEAVSQEISKNIGERPTRPCVRDSDKPSRVFSNTRRKSLVSSH